MKEQSSCECKVPCEQTNYEPSLSYAQLSKFNIDRMVLNDPVRRANVNNKFLRARELSQRVIKDVADGDRVKLIDIKNKLNVFWEDIQVVAPALQEDSKFAELYDTLPLIEYGDDLFRNDLISLGERLFYIGTLFAPVLQTNMMYIDKYLPAVVGNLMELSTSGSQLLNRTMVCNATGSVLFPLPDYDGDIHGYFDTLSRKKRDHDIEVSTVANFYANDAPEYLKLQDQSKVPNCGDYLSLKQDLAGVLSSHRAQLETDHDHISVINASFTNFFEYMYKNTSKSPTEFPKYLPCLGLLNVLQTQMWDEIDKLTEALNDFSSASDMNNLLGSLVNLTTIVSYSSLPQMATYGITNQILFQCGWPFFEYLSEEYKGADIGKFNSYYVDLNNAYLSYPTLRISWGNLGEYTLSMYNIMDQTIIPSLGVIDDYLEERVTKMDMANVFDSLLLQKALQDIVALSADFISIAREFDQRFKSALHNVKLGYWFIFNTSLPLVDNDVIWNWEIIAHTRDHNVSHMNDLLDRLFTADFQEQGNVFAEILIAFTSDYTDPIEELKLRLPAEIDELIKSINVMMEELLTYIEDNKMNQWFFM